MAKVNTVLVWLRPPPVKLVRPTGMKASPGAQAHIVDGPWHFPRQCEALKRRLGADADDFVWVVWSRRDARVNGQPDGAYARARFSEG